MVQPGKRKPRPSAVISGIELLEKRDLLSGTSLALDEDSDLHGQFDYDGLEFHALDPVDEFSTLDPVDEIASADGAGSSDGSSGGPVGALVVPAYHSNLGASVSVYLDFDGHYEANWGWFTNITTPAFDTDGNSASFSAGELTQIYEIWQRVTEDFAPFNVDVTTELPASFADGVSLRVAIGGSSADWYEPQGGGPAGGVAYVNSFTSSSIPNVVYVFPKELAKNAKYIAEASSHEAGHGFGLNHQSAYNSSGQKTYEYNPGSGNWGPIMGNSYYTSISTWHNGTTTSSSTYQDDMAVIARPANGFGYRADDYGSTLGTASSLNVAAGAFSATGIIAQNSDVDVFSFTAGSGAATIQINVASVGANLDAVLEIYSSDGTLVVSANPSNSQSASVSTTLAMGTYYALVKSNGSYGRVGQYTLTGTVGTSTNVAPLVNAGSDLTIALSDSATLNGTVSDDGMPSSPGTVTTTWTKISGPGTVTFDDASAIDTDVSFSVAGTYVLRLTATDGELTSSDTVTVLVMQDGTTITVAMQEGVDSYSGMTDSTIQGSAKNTTKNYGSKSRLDADGNPDKAALLRWDLSGIPGGVTVESVSITIHVTNGSKSVYDIYGVLGGWNESSVTWEQASSGITWGSLGAELAGVDHSAASFGTVASTGKGYLTFNLNATGIAKVQQWLDTPSSNHGLILQNYNDVTSDGLTFDSSEAKKTYYRPMLSITYSAADSGALGVSSSQPVFTAPSPQAANQSAIPNWVSSPIGAQQTLSLRSEISSPSATAMGQSTPQLSTSTARDDIGQPRVEASEQGSSELTQLVSDLSEALELSAHGDGTDDASFWNLADREQLDQFLSALDEFYNAATLSGELLGV